MRSNAVQGYKLGSSKLDLLESIQTRRSSKKNQREFFVRQLCLKSGVFTKKKDQTVDTETMFLRKLFFVKKQSFVQPGAQLLALTKTKFSLAKGSGLQRPNFTTISGKSIFSFDKSINHVLFTNSYFYRLSSHRRLGYLYNTNLDKMSFLSYDLANLALSVRTYLFLKQKGINKIGNLLAYSPQSLFLLLNRDKERFAEVKRCFLLLSINEKS